MGADSTVDGTAVAGSDYVAQWGTLMFPVGTTRQVVLVPVLAAAPEPKESLSLRLSAARGAVIQTAEANGVIQDDDARQREGNVRRSNGRRTFA